MLGPDDVTYRNRCVWNRRKNDLNKRKHHLSFETMSLVFAEAYYEQLAEYLGGEDED